MGAANVTAAMKRRHANLVWLSNGSAAAAKRQEVWLKQRVSLRMRM
jgi:hypothetical protein